MASHLISFLTFKRGISLKNERVFFLFHGLVVLVKYDDYMNNIQTSLVLGKEIVEEEIQDFKTVSSKKHVCMKFPFKE